MATYTDHYNFPKYEATDLPNLLDQYNNFADGADAQIYAMNTSVQGAQSAAQSASQAAQAATDKAESVASEFSTLENLVGTSTGTGTVFEQLATLNSEVAGFDSAIDGKAPTNHASTTAQYGAASTSNYGHIKIAASIDSGDNSSAVTASQVRAYVGDMRADITAAQNAAESAQSAATSAASDASTALTRANSAYNAINGGWESVQNGNSGAIDWEVFYNDAAKLVMVAVNFTSSYPKTNGDVTLGTLASSYRPTDTEMGVIAIVITGASNFGACQAIVNSSGQLKLRFGGVGTNDFAFYSGNMFFPVS